MYTSLTGNFFKTLLCSDTTAITESQAALFRILRDIHVQRRLQHTVSEAEVTVLRMNQWTGSNAPHEKTPRLYSHPSVLFISLRA